MEKAPLSFEDTATAFQAKSDADLNRAYWLFKLISFNWLVKMSPPFVNFALWAKLPVKGIIRATAFRHFCGGESIEDCKGTIQALGAYGIGTILDYSVEGKEEEEEFDKSLDQTLSTIEQARKDDHIPFSVFKPTGFARMALLEKKNSGQLLTAEEEQEYSRFKQRILRLCQAGADAGVPIYIDAEESWIQDVIDAVATEMMQRFNREKVIIFNTLQLYRHDRYNFLLKSYNHAVSNNYLLGVKLVRGAYMEKERERAQKEGYPSPIHDSKTKSDEDYNRALRFCIEHIDRISFCAGTHNEFSCLLLTELMTAHSIPHDHPHIWFSQLYGMSDHISYNLAKHGYNVSKYVPYGPVAAVLPYLIRRAQENTSVAGQTSRELLLIRRERQRRKGIK